MFILQWKIEETGQESTGVEIITFAGHHDIPVALFQVLTPIAVRVAKSERGVRAIYPMASVWRSTMSDLDTKPDPRLPQWRASIS